MIEDLEHWRQTFDKLTDALEDIDAVVGLSETSLSEISRSAAVTESQRLQRIRVRASC